MRFSCSQFMRRAPSPGYSFPLLKPGDKFTWWVHIRNGDGKLSGISIYKDMRMKFSCSQFMRRAPSPGYSFPLLKPGDKFTWWVHIRNGDGKLSGISIYKDMRMKFSCSQFMRRAPSPGYSFPLLKPGDKFTWWVQIRNGDGKLSGISVYKDEDEVQLLSI